jgi:hypothetical protein
MHELRYPFCWKALVIWISVFLERVSRRCIVVGVVEMD